MQGSSYNELQDKFNDQEDGLFGGYTAGDDKKVRRNGKVVYDFFLYETESNGWVVADMRDRL